MGAEIFLNSISIFRHTDNTLTATNDTITLRHFLCFFMYVENAICSIDSGKITLVDLFPDVRLDLLEPRGVRGELGT
jgi:hypothetical protein